MWTIAVGTYGDVGMPTQADRAEHVVQPGFNVTAHRRDPVAGVDERQDATPDFQASPIENECLECQMKVLHAGRAFDLDQFPQVARGRIATGKTTTHLKKRLSGCRRI